MVSRSYISGNLSQREIAGSVSLMRPAGARRSRLPCVDPGEHEKVNYLRGRPDRIKR